MYEEQEKLLKQIKSDLIECCNTIVYNEKLYGEKLLRKFISTIEEGSIEHKKLLMNIIRNKKCNFKCSKCPLSSACYDYCFNTQKDVYDFALEIYFNLYGAEELVEELL